MRLAARTPPPYKLRNAVFVIVAVALKYVKLPFSHCDLLGGFLVVFCMFLHFLQVYCQFSANIFCTFLASSLNTFLQVRCRCSALCLVCGAFGEYQNLIQEVVLGVTENYFKCGLKCSNFHQNHEQCDQWLQAASLAQGCFGNAKNKHRLLRNWWHSAPLGQFLVP